MTQADLIVLGGSAMVVVFMIAVAGLLGFHHTARLDEAELARLAASEAAHVEKIVIDAKGRAAIAKLSGGKLLIAKVMADGVSARVLPQGQARVRAARGRVSVTFGDLGYPSLNMRLDNPPAWLAELGARP